MKVLRYIQAVVSGKIKRQNRTEGVVVDSLWQVAEKLRYPNSIVFENFIVSCGIVIDSLVWEIRKPGISEVVDIDTRRISFSITLQQMQELYSILLSYFVSMFYSTFPLCPSWKEELKKALFDVIYGSEAAKTLLQSIEDMEAASRNGWFAPGGRVLDEVGRIIGPELVKDVRLLTYFTMISQTLFYEAVKDISEEYDFSDRLVTK